MRALFTRHPLMKAIALVAAFLLWSVVREEQRTEISTNVEIKPVNVPEGLVVAGEIDRAVHIRIAGPRTRLKKLGDGSFQPFQLDLADGRRGVNSFTVYEEDFALPRGTHITRISPQVIRVTLDQVEQRFVRVEPRFVGVLEDGFDLLEAKISPPHLTLRGARGELAGIRTLPTEPISLAERRGSFEGTFAVRDVLPQWEIDQKRVTVTVKIGERSIVKTLPGVPVGLTGQEAPVRVEPETVLLKMRGPAGLVASLASEKLSVEVDLTGWPLKKARKRTFRVKPVPPQREGVEITMVPDTVRVTLLTN